MLERTGYNISSGEGIEVNNETLLGGVQLYIETLKDSGEISHNEYQIIQTSLNSWRVKKLAATATSIELINWIPMRVVAWGSLAFLLYYTDGNIGISYLWSKGIDKGIKFLYSIPIAYKQKVPNFVAFSFVNALPYVWKYMAPPIWLNQDKELVKHLLWYTQYKVNTLICNIQDPVLRKLLVDETKNKIQQYIPSR